MKRSGVLSALRMMIVFTLVTGIVYPLFTTVLAQLVFPHEADGSLITKEGKLTSAASEAVGSVLLGQKFQETRYFWSRPSATDYNAAASGGSNLGPTSKKLVDQVKLRVAQVRKANDVPPGKRVPADMVTTSASGLDPDMSVDSALLQVPRVAQARGLTQESLRSLIRDHTNGRTFGVLGSPRVNVLKLNLALDHTTP